MGNIRPSKDIITAVSLVGSSVSFVLKKSKKPSASNVAEEIIRRRSGRFRWILMNRILFLLSLFTSAHCEEQQFIAFCQNTLFKHSNHYIGIKTTLVGLVNHNDAVP